MEQPTVQRRRGERRRLWDRRSPITRRSGADRRERNRRGDQHAFAGTDRRARSDRRRADRRSEPERRALQVRRRGRRRRETPTPYSAEHVAELRARFAGQGPVSCPACGSAFTLGPGRRRGSETARRVMCLGCGRAAVVPDSHAARVLLVDQHEQMRETLQVILSAEGHEVVEAADAGVALAAYQMVPADVVIINVLAPGRMSAADFLRQLRRSFPDARVVALAGRPSFTGVDKLAVSQGLGAARTIRLPVTREDLLRTVDEVRH